MDLLFLFRDKLIAHCLHGIFNSTGTGGPAPGSKFTGCDGKTYTRTAEGGIPDEVGKPEQQISNSVGTLSMANTGKTPTYSIIFISLDSSENSGGLSQSICISINFDLCERVVQCGKFSSLSYIFATGL